MCFLTALVYRYFAKENFGHIKTCDQIAINLHHYGFMSQTMIYFLGVCNLMVIIGNRHSDPRSNI